MGWCACEVCGSLSDSLDVAAAGIDTGLLHDFILNRHSLVFPCSIHVLEVSGQFVSLLGVGIQGVIALPLELILP